MTNFYLITIFVILLAGVEAADKVTSDTWHLPDQGASASKEDWLARQRSICLGRDVRVVVVYGVQSHLRTEPAELTEQAVGALLRSGWSRSQDLEAGTIHSFYFSVSFRINLFIMLDSMLQKKSTGVEPHYLNIWLPVHDNDEATTEKLVSNNIKYYA
jgi:hypothetical protein